MKIDHTNVPVEGLLRGNPVRAVKVSSAESPADGVVVTLSARSTQALESKGDKGAESPFDAARVEEIKNAIRSGGIKVDVSRIADGLINSVSLMLSSR